MFIPTHVIISRTFSNGRTTDAVASSTTALDAARTLKEQATRKGLVVAAIYIRASGAQSLYWTAE